MFCMLEQDSNNTPFYAYELEMKRRNSLLQIQFEKYYIASAEIAELIAGKTVYLIPMNDPELAEFNQELNSNHPCSDSIGIFLIDSMGKDTKSVDVTLYYASEKNLSSN